MESSAISGFGLIGNQIKREWVVYISFPLFFRVKNIYYNEQNIKSGTAFRKGFGVRVPVNIFYIFRVKNISYNEEIKERRSHSMDVYYVNKDGVKLSQEEYEDEIANKDND